MLTIQELRQLDTLALQEEISNTQKDLFKIRFKTRSGNSKEIHMIRKLRKYIARVKTLQKETEIQKTEPEKKSSKKETTSETKKMKKK